MQPLAKCFFKIGGIVVKKYLLVFFLVIFSALIFGAWQPATDYREFEYVAYSYEIPEDNDATTVFNITTYIKKTDNGYTVTNQIVREFPDEPLDMVMLTGGFYGYITMFFMNPLGMMMLNYLDFDEMIPMKIMGFGTIRYEGEEKVGKYKGQKVVLYDEEKEPVFSWVINPEIPLIIKSVFYDDNMTVTLLDYKMAEK